MIAGIAPARHGAARPASHRQSGISLPFALFGLAGMALAAAALVRAVDSNTSYSNAVVVRESAILGGERGIEAAAARLATLIAANATGADSTANNYRATMANLANNSPVPASLRDSSITNLVVDDSVSSGNRVRWLIERMCTTAGAPSVDNCVGGATGMYYRVTARTEAANGTTSFLQAVLTDQVFISTDAYRTSDRLEISGSSGVTGACNTVHTNFNLKADPGIAAASGITYSGTNLQPGGSDNDVRNPATAARPLPAISPATYRNHADYELRADGRVYAWNNDYSARVQIADTSGGTEWRTWKRDSTSPVRWTKGGGTGDVHPGALYFVEGSVYIGSNPGEGGGTSNDWKISILATGHIEISGNPEFVDHRCPFTRNQSHAVTNSDCPASGRAVPAGVQNIVFMAGTDLKISGNPVQRGSQAIFAAGEQILISGNGAFLGYMLAGNQGNADSLVDGAGADKGDYLSGSWTLRYDCNLVGPWAQGMRRLSWREVMR